MDVIRYERADWKELYWLQILGLKIFDVNEGAEGLENPMITFLREVVTAIPCAAHLSIDPWDYRYEEYAIYYPPERILPTPVAVYSHMSISLGDEDRPYGAYLPRFLPEDLLAKDEDGEPLIDTLLQYDQPVLYAGIDSDNEPNLRQLFMHPPFKPGFPKYDWFYEATGIVPLVVIGGGDESYYHVATRSPEYFDLLRAPLERTEAAIKATAWYQQNADVLQWSDEWPELCLILPCGNRERRRRCE